MPDEIRFICATCGGPIYSGEPIVWDGADPESTVSHRFSTWCAHYRAQDQAFQKAVGIEDPS